MRAEHIPTTLLLKIVKSQQANKKKANGYNIRLLEKVKHTCMSICIVRDARMTLAVYWSQHFHKHDQA